MTICFHLEPSGEPLNFIVNSNSSTSIILTWNHPGYFLRNGIIENYIISYNSSLAKYNQTVTPSNDTVYVVSHLDKYTTYSFSVWPCNQVGKGLIAAYGENTTYEDSKCTICLHLIFKHQKMLSLNSIFYLNVVNTNFFKCLVSIIKYYFNLFMFLFFLFSVNDL